MNDPGSHPVAERGVYQPVLFERALAAKDFRNDNRLEMSSVARYINLSARKPGFDQMLDLFWCHYCLPYSAAGACPKLPVIAPRRNGST